MYSISIHAMKNATRFLLVALFLLGLPHFGWTADIYLRSTDGADGDNGSTWALAKATLAAAMTAAGAGGRVFVSDNHAETQASAMTLTSPGTAASPTQVLCVDDAGNPQPPTALATTATVSTTGVNAINFAGSAYCYGIAFQSGDAANNGTIQFNSAAGAWWWRLERCNLRLNNTATTGFILCGAFNGNDSQLLELINTTVQFGAVGQALRVDSGRLVWRDTDNAILGTNPTTLFTSLNGAAGGGDVRVRAVDLEGPTNLIASNIDLNYRFLFENCKLGAGVVVGIGAVAAQGGLIVTLANCDSGDTNYRWHSQSYQGTVTHETTIVRTGGATDGTTPVSRKMVSTANSKFYSPLESTPVVFWNETVGSAITISIPVITDNVTLTDAEAWIEVEYLGTSGFPLALNASDRAATIFATPANQTTDASSTWTTTGLTTPVKQELSVSFTPQEKGLVRARVMLAKASTTMYFDPKVKGGSPRQVTVGESGYINQEPFFPRSIGGGPVQ